MLTPYKKYVFEEIYKRELQFLLTGQNRKDFLKWYKEYITHTDLSQGKGSS
jgi:hypothetical protein